MLCINTNTVSELQNLRQWSTGKRVFEANSQSQISAILTEVAHLTWNGKDKIQHMKREIKQGNRSPITDRRNVKILRPFLLQRVAGNADVRSVSCVSSEGFRLGTLRTKAA
nr:hypothetical protein Iba_chr01cCG4040 [Ipomoea batatas]